LKVRELIELNQMITDVEITIRQNGTLRLDQLNIGPERGEKPKYPTRVPIKPEYAGLNDIYDNKKYHEAAYIPKSINAWDDGKDYWQVKPNRIPEKWLELEVYSWEVWPASSVCYTSPRRRQTQFHGQRLNITALPSGEKMEVTEPKPKQEQTEQLEGQMSIDDWNYEVMEV
jgi:hypothetical protein